MVKQPFGGSIGGLYTKCHIYIIYMIHIDTSLVVQRCCATWPMNLSKAYHWNSGRRSPCLLVCSLSIPDMCNISCTLPRIRCDMHFFLCPLESLKSTLNSFKEINQNRNYTTKKNLQKWIYIYILIPSTYFGSFAASNQGTGLHAPPPSAPWFSEQPIRFQKVYHQKTWEKWLKFLMKLRFIHCSWGPTT